MGTAAPGGLVQRVRSLSPRTAVLTGGALMGSGQVVFAVMLLAGAGIPSPDASALLVIPVMLTGIAMLWLGPVVVSLAADQPGWIGAIALPGGYAVWVLGTFGTDALADGAALAIVEGALPVLSFAGALAVVGGGRVWRRLAGVAVIAGLAGAVSSLLAGVGGVVSVGLVAAVGFLVWVAPRARPPAASRSSDAAGTTPADGR